MMRSVRAAALALALGDAAFARQFPEKRQTSKTVTLPLFQSQDSAYLANITVGTPPQTVTVQIDTGSSDLWVFANNVRCDDDEGCIGPYFNSGASSSFTNIGTGLFNSSYGDGSVATGDYIEETISFGGATIHNMTIGLAHNAQSDLPFWGIMGIDFIPGEFIFGNPGGDAAPGRTEYFNLPYWMTAQGLINEPVYSLYLNDIDATSSSLLFGGIDTDKFTGPLTIFDVETTERDREGNEYFTFFNAPLTAVGAVDASGHIASFSSQEMPVSVILDSGSSALTLPQDTVEDIFQQLGVTNSRRDGPTVPCSLANSGTTIGFQFGGSGGVLIGVSVAEMVIPDGTGSNICAFAVGAGEPGEYILGDSFLRSAYVVFDSGNAQIALAQANLNVTNSAVQALSAVATVPSTAAGTQPASLVAQGTGYGSGGIPGSTIVGIAEATASATGVPGRVTATALATSRAGSATGIGGGTSIAGIATIGQTHAANNPTPTSDESGGSGGSGGNGGSGGGPAAASGSQVSAAGHLSPPNLASIFAVAGTSVVAMIGGLGGAALIFAGL